jgi:hypothetical protein
MVAVFGVSTIVLDYLQFLGGYYAVNSALKNEGGGFIYDDKSFSYKLRLWAFYAKQVTTVIGALLLLFSLFAYYV